MAKRTSVKLHNGTVERLYDLKDRGDSYDDVVRELIAIRDQLSNEQIAEYTRKDNRESEAESPA